VGQGHGRRTSAQVALAWLRGRGALPIPGAKNRSQAEENLGAADFDLSGEELDALARAASVGSPG
jgi:pyridoxine 4-dehydrogenase